MNFDGFVTRFSFRFFLKLFYALNRRNTFDVWTITFQSDGYVAVRTEFSRYKTSVDNNRPVLSKTICSLQSTEFRYRVRYEHEVKRNVYPNGGGWYTGAVFRVRLTTTAGRLTIIVSVFQNETF